MQLKDCIYKRKSVRKYTDTAVNADTVASIARFLAEAKPLYPDIKVRVEILPRSKVHSLFKWTPPQAIAFYSEEKDGYLENAGFLLQQVDLYLHSIGLGSCWLGMGKPNVKADVPLEEGWKFVIMLAFGYPAEEIARGTDGFNRNTLAEISDRADERLEAARLAPSAINSQPWYFTHEGETLHAWQSQKGMLRAAMLGRMNQIDMGIALAHLYVENTQTFRFFAAQPKVERKNYRYTGSFTL